jgi:hypothetical protein
MVRGQAICKHVCQKAFSGQDSAISNQLSAFSGQRTRDGNLLAHRQWLMAES